MTYEIHEANWERLTSRLTTLKNKCAKYGCEFTFNTLGEKFETIKQNNGESHTVRYVVIEAEGKAIINDWEFIGTIEHHTERNVMRLFNREATVPANYFTTDSICEHCNTTRNRVDTYLIRNIVTGEFKQVGRSCLKDFTKGMDAALIASAYEFFRELEDGFTVGDHYTRYFKRDEVMRAAAEYIRAYGFVSSNNEFNAISTKDHVYSFLTESTAEFKQLSKDDIVIDTESFEAIELADAAITWALSQGDDFGYLGNLKTILSETYIKPRNFGITVSGIRAYQRELEKTVELQKEKAVEAVSDYVGEVGTRLTLTGRFFFITSWDTQFGSTRLYKFTTTDGNVCMWKTSGYAPEEDEVTIKGTVTEHSEYRGIKQTHLSRCKVVSQ